MRPSENPQNSNSAGTIEIPLTPKTPSTVHLHRRSTTINTPQEEPVLSNDPTTYLFYLSPPPAKANMSYEERANAHPNLGDESDVEEEALVNDYREQVNFDDDMSDLDRTTSIDAGSQAQDLQAQLAAAATPLEYQATLETKFASYDNYCNLFHYILNSEGPVDLEVPSVCDLVLLFVSFWRCFSVPGFVLLCCGN